jgi:ribosome-associated translation inhibitor RaiA
MPKAQDQRTRRSQRETPGPEKRTPFAKVVPKPVRRRAGRTRAPLVPAAIRVAGVELQPEHRVYIRERLGMKLGKYAMSIERASVRVRDVNGPKGGIDYLCRIKVVLSGLPSVVVSQQAESIEAAVNAALDAVERAVRRTLQRRRTKPIKRITREY